MEIVKVDVLNPKAIKLLKNLADLDMIAIRKSTKSEFSEVLERILFKSDLVQSPDEIAGEIEAVRSRPK